MRKKFVNGFSAALCGATLLVGCVVDRGDLATEELGTVTEAVGEVGCGTLGGRPYAGSSANGSTKVGPGCGGLVQSVGFTTYGTDSSCPGQYIAEFTSMPTGVAHWASMEVYAFFPSAVECAKLSGSFAIYKFNSSTNAYYVDSTATFSSLGFANGKCEVKGASVSGTNNLRVVGRLLYNGVLKDVRMNLSRPVC